MNENKIKNESNLMKENKIIGFYKNRKVYFAVSISIMIIGIIFAFTKGVKLDIQFKGGALLRYTYEGDINSEAAADLATKKLGRPVTTQITSDLKTMEKNLVFNIPREYA